MHLQGSSLKHTPHAGSLLLPLGLSFPRTLSGVLSCFFSVAGAVFDTDNQFDRIENHLEDKPRARPGRDSLA